MAKFDFDLESAMTQQGRSIESYDPNTGTATIVNSDGSKADFDVSGYLKSKNMSLTDVDIKFNSPETAKSDSALGFMDQVQMIYASKPQDQMHLLESKYGKGNVAQVGGELKVKDQDGMWKRADAKWYSELAANSPQIAASIAGTIKGATLGAPAGPAGAVIGGVLGGATSAALASYGEQKFAELAGIRSEQDIADTASELGREFATNVVFDVATLGAGKVLKAMSPFNKVKIAETLGSLVDGTKAGDWMVAMRSAWDAKAVKGIAEADATALAKGGLQAELLPSTKKMASIFSESVESAKETAERMYERGIKELNAAGILEKSDIPIERLRNTLVGSMGEAGLIAVNGAGNPVFKSHKEMAASMVGVVDESAQKRLKNVFGVVEDLYAKSKGQVDNVTLDDVLKLRRYVNEVQKDLGHFMSKSSVSDKADRILAALSSETNNLFKTSANAANVKIKGQLAGDYMAKLNADYSQFRSGYDFVSKKAKDLDVLNLGNANELAKMVGKLDSEGGAAVLESYQSMAKAINSEDMMNKLVTLQQLKAGKSLASRSGGKGSLGAIKSYVGMTPKGVGEAVTAGTEFAGAVKNVLPKPQIMSAMQKLAPIAKGSQFLKSLPPESRANMLIRNDLTSEFLQSILGADITRQQTEDELMSRVK